MKLSENDFKNYTAILREELIPAMGCTEPIAIAYAAAMTRKLLGEMPIRITVNCSGNIIKNVKGVTVPNSGGQKGIEVAAILGMVGGDPDKKLEVIAGVTDEDREECRRLNETKICDVNLSEDVPNLYIEIIMESEEHTACVRIAYHHTDIVYMSKDQEILRDVVENYDRKKIVETEEHHLFAEFSKEYAYDCGITVCGEIDENNRFQMEYYYPYFEGGQISSYEEVSVERHVDKESFAGACDDMRLGITMIFYLTHAAEYLEMKQKNALQPLPLPLSVSGLAAEGTILLPIQKDPEQVEKERRSTQQKNSLISAARNGDEDAMESLTMDDIDTYAMISQRLTKEDVFSIVDSFFMPSGLECDQYSVMGEITEMNTTKNAVTGEQVYELGLVCNDVPIDICINEKDLFGVPEVGRRFKGQIWLQGMLEHL